MRLESRKEIQMLSFAVINESKHIRPTDVELIVAACAEQLSTQICPAWNLVPPQIKIIQNLKDAPQGAIVHAFLDNPDVQDALGYHDLTPQGQPFIRSFVEPTLQNHGSIMNGSNSFSQTASHEFGEATVNPLIYSWADDMRSGVVALEIGDPVENDSYNIIRQGKPVAVSNFVLPSWFSPLGHGKFDFMGRVSRPRTMSRGGYTIVARMGSESEKFARDVEFNTPEEAAEYPAWKTALKLTPGSRTLRYIS
jgi:hypothetical protein